MRSDIQTDLNNAAQPATSRRKFLSSAGALGAASALPMIAGGAGMLLPGVASANSGALVDTNFYVGPGNYYGGITTTLYRNLYVYKKVETIDPGVNRDLSIDPKGLLQFTYYIIGIIDQYYHPGGAQLLLTNDSSVCNGRFEYNIKYNSSQPYPFLTIKPSDIRSDTKCNSSSLTPGQRNGPLSLIPENSSGFCTHAARIGESAPLFSILTYHRDGSSVQKFKLVRLRKVVYSGLDTSQIYEYSSEVSSTQANAALAAMDRLSSAINNFEKKFNTLHPTIKCEFGYLLSILLKSCSANEVSVTLICFLFNQTNLVSPPDSNYYYRLEAVIELAAKATACVVAFRNAASNWTQASWSTSGTWCKNLT